MAGRTDAGVHATGQVASFITASRRPLETFARGLSALLPEDISVQAAADVPLTFDPRRQALGRWYRYTIHVGGQRPALLRRFLWHVPQRLDFKAMKAAAAHLPGRHNFAAFTQPSLTARRRTERLVTSASLRRMKGLVIFDIEANAFLQQMVRRLVGALLEVGLAKRTAADFARLLREARPGAATLAAPPRGLCLMKVRYESGLFDDETDEDIQPECETDR